MPLVLTERRPARVLAAIVGTLSLLAGSLLFAEAGWMWAKAEVAERLIDQAFRRHLADGGAHAPWSWADTTPLARLEVPRLGIRRTVLAGATGAVLAFGPGHVHGTALPNRPGNCAIAGHRDGWFRFLGQLRPGDEVRLTTREGTRRYRVERTSVHDRGDTSVLATTTGTRLTLITCYPIDGVLPTTERYVVSLTPFDATAREAAGPDDASTCAGTDECPADRG